MAWGAAALSTFLDGSVPTLNHAFGLTLKASRPRDDDRRRELAAKASDLKQAGCTWKQVADAFYESGESITDDRSIRSLVLEYRVELISREVSRRVDAGHLGGK